MTVQLIPFQIETQRVLQLLSKQIYQSPLALLRENAQNAFDAILQRKGLGHAFEPRIEIKISRDEVCVIDNGIGMTDAGLARHYWFAGSSSKNNDAARAAGVVGTFGIGAMANFGIASEVVVETESALTGARTRSRAIGDKLTLNKNCIEVEAISSRGVPGTQVSAKILPASHLNVTEAVRYITDFVALLQIPVMVNGVNVSGQIAERFVPRPPTSWSTSGLQQKLGPRLTSDFNIAISQNADIWIALQRIAWGGRPLAGHIVLRSSTSALRTFRSSFGLATASVGSYFQFGGVVDLTVLEPTAGREALTTDSTQFLQSLVTEIDAFSAVTLSGRAECDASTGFMNWTNAHSRYDLAKNLRMTIRPGDRIPLSEVEVRTRQSPMALYDGTDNRVIERHAHEETPLLLLARSHPRRQCEAEFLKRYCSTTAVETQPVVEERIRPAELTLAQRALGFRVEAILDSDYFLKAHVSFGRISYGLPLLATRQDGPVDICLDPKGQTVALILGLYENEFAAFGSMVTDFVRTFIFPKVSEFVPSSTRQGAEAFLRMIRMKPRDIFEYDNLDLGDLPTIWGDYADGRITMAEAVERSVATVRASVQFFDSAASARIRDVLPDVIQNARAMSTPDSAPDELEPAPAIMRTETTSAAKLLTIPDSEPPLRGYRCFLAITDRAQRDFGDFFLQPHRTSVVWGGQKALFIFLHHSGRFGLYYDLQTREAISAETGGKASPTCTIVLRDRIYIPIPEPIRASFVPSAGERKRFDVRAEIIRTEREGEGK